MHSQLLSRFAIALIFAFLTTCTLCQDPNSPVVTGGAGGGAAGVGDIADAGPPAASSTQAVITDPVQTGGMSLSTGP